MPQLSKCHNAYTIIRHLEPVPVSNRKRFMNVSPETEMLMAKQAYEQVLQQFRHRILPPNHPYSIFVRKVARNLIKVSGLEDLKWEVHVVDDPQKNAFVLPGGKIFVFTGLLPIVEDEAGMAAVLGHEIAHQVARHSAEKLSYMTITTILQLLLAALFDPNMVLTRIFVEFGINMPFSRKMESEADYIGLRLMAQACYDPNAAVRMWQRMKEVVNHSEVMAYLGTHPSPGKRIENIKEWLPEAQLIRENSDCYQVTSS
ncbi:peptidase family M48-domain-containing protein [Fimicolochytrium jonesii]|uniref:peptidase family M48-domain-containing protein n=1 Tax=Fimicolochytrium jonesii TaxID=1396493 RepID=UPI0022FE4B9A|nr:peptidase family M48-domain-containing protein [Fimicolochytrium jonesii]KAI8815969.1 peptidase family M48-domain-containing protein [Fimicolochytrium jonesii]